MFVAVAIVGLGGRWPQRGRSSGRKRIADGLVRFSSIRLLRLSGALDFFSNSFSRMNRIKKGRVCERG